MERQDTLDVTPIDHSHKIAKIQLSIPQFVLNATEMDVYVSMFTEEMKFVDSALIHIPPDVYKNWGTDDNHIINYVLSKLQSNTSSQSPTPAS
jgi:hypothetical protein